MDIINSFIAKGNSYIWLLLVFLLLGAGLYFSIITRFVQIRYFGYMWKCLFSSRRSNGNRHITSFQAFSTSLAARVGTGNIVGVAFALSVGGPGAMIWMWVVALVGMATSFVESSLAQLYKQRHSDGTYRGGPAYYIKYGLKQNWMAVLFAVLIIGCFGLTFNAVQSQTIVESITNTIAGEDATIELKAIIASILVVLVASVIFFGVKGVVRVAEITVPFMAVVYVSVALFIILTNIAEVPAVFKLMILDAFGNDQTQAMAGGFLGGIWVVLEQGVRRGLFSNEAGMGSAPNAAAMAKTDPDHPAIQGFVQSLGVFTDTIILCSATGFMILLSSQYVPFVEVKGVILTQAAMSEHIGSFANVFVSIAIFFFAFTSIIANYTYGATNMRYLGVSGKGMHVYRLILLCFVLWGALQPIKTVFDTADLVMGLMALVNLVAIILLSKYAVKILKDFERRRKNNISLDFDLQNFKDITENIDDKAWK